MPPNPVTTSNSGATVVLTLDCSTINAGDHLVVTANNVTNPTAASSGDVISIATTSDTVPANTPAYTIGGSVTTTITATPSSSPEVYGLTVTYKATVTSPGGTPTGTVAFTAGTTTLCTATLSGGTGTCTSAAAPTGSDTITGTYSGDSNFLGSTGTVALSVGQAASKTTITATPSSPPDAYGQTVTYGATVSDNTTSSTGTPTGTVAITSGSTTLCTVTLSGGTGYMHLGGRT